MAELVQLVLINELGNIEGRERRRNRQRLDPFNEMSDAQFIKVFRLSKELVQFLIHLLENYIAPARRATDLDISAKVK